MCVSERERQLVWQDCLLLRKKNSFFSILAEIHLSFHDKIMYSMYINSSRFFSKYAAKLGHTEKNINIVAGHPSSVYEISGFMDQ